MSEVLATSPALDGEAPTVEGRLADIFETAEIQIDEYKLSDSDRAKVVLALRNTVAVREIIEECKHDFTSCDKCGHEERDGVSHLDFFILINGAFRDDQQSRESA